MLKSLILFLVVFWGFQLIVIGQGKPVRKVNISSLYDKVQVPFINTDRQKQKSTSHLRNHTTEAICDTILLTRQSQIDSFKILYPGCTSVQLLEVSGQGASPAITQLDSLNEIQSILQKLKISHTSITSLSALSALVSLGDTLELQYNFLQTSIGLNNLNYLGDVIINKLPALNSIAGLSNNIDSIGGVFIDSTSLTSLNGLGSVVHMDGYLDLRYSPIVNLGNLSNLTSINGYLRLENLPSLSAIGLSNLEYVFGFLFSGLNNLTSLSGLSNNLTTNNLGTIWMINTGLTNLSGLDNITGCVNFYFWLNPNMTSLHGMQNVSGNVGSGVSLWANDALTDITALNGITSIAAGTLEIHGNNLLSNLTGLGNITVIGERLRIFENPVITSLDFLNPALDIQDNNNDGLEIRDNNQLSLCSFTPLCNFLNGGGIADIQNNAVGCNSIPEILITCNTCTNPVLKTWTGLLGTDWDNAGNWSPAAVPVSCDTVYIPTGLSDYPVVNSNITIHGLIMESSASLDIDNYSLLNNGTINIFDATIISTNSSNSIIFRNATDISIENATLSATNISIERYSGQLYFIENLLDGNVTISDSISRVGPNTIYGNTVNGNLTITTNSPEANAETFISPSGWGADEVFGDVTFNINAPVLFRVGDGNTLRIDRDLNLNTNVDPQFIEFNDITFIGGSESHIRQLGSTPVTIQNLYLEKFSHQSYIIPEQNIYIGNNVHFFGGVIKTTPTKLIIFNDNTSIDQTSSESWVWGPLKKIGNEQFSFPVGDSLRQGKLTILSPPLATDAYTAQYFHSNPTAAGYDTAQHVSNLTRISGAEYWTLNRDAGSSNVLVSLTYDSTRSNQTGSIYSLRVSQWNPSQWQNKGSTFLSGNLAEATLTSASPITDYTQPLTLGYIEPPIIPVITLSNMDSIICRGNSIKVRFTVDTLMFSGNNFIAQLSDSTGSFSNPTNIGSLSGVNHSDSITAFIPSITPGSNEYRVRVMGTSPPDTSINSKPLSVRSIPLLSFTILGPGTGCISTGIHTYFASQKEPGVTYNWSLSGGGTFTTNQDTAYFTWTTTGTHTITLSTSNLCGNGPSANKQITVSQPAPTAVPILNNAGRWLYSSVPDANQYATGIHWYRNDTLISGALSSSWYASLAGTYKVKYFNPCGESPASDLISFAANSIPQNIIFPAMPNKTFGDAPFIPNATASSGLPVSFTIVSGPASINFQSNLLTITGTGLVTVMANQPGDNVYDTTAPVIRSFTVNKASQTISFPVIVNQNFGNPPVNLLATASSGLPIIHSVVSGPATVSGNQLILTGLGTVTLRASQNGDTNYLAAIPVDKNFCISVASLNHISGYSNLCPATATYTVNSIPGATYFWRIVGGSTLASTTNTAIVNWTTPGTFSLLVSASGNCGAASANDTLVVTVINSIQPDSVQSMLPANGAINQQLPLTLSWVPAQPNLFYTFDLYVWRADSAQPLVPYAANLTTVNYTLPLNSGVQYNQTYKWMVVAHNGSCTILNTGPIQQFSLIPLPDLVVQNVQAPTTAFSGQAISISWTITNPGPGKTTTNQSWTDGVFLSFDTLPNFSIPPQTNPGVWGGQDYPSRPLLIATRPNVSALDSGQQYTNSVNFTLPLSYSLPLYAYVITNFPAGAYAPVQVTRINDTARAPQAIAITLSPTPDLRVDTVFSPTTTFSGSTINLTYKVKNYGVLTPTGAVWTDKVYFSQSPLFNINTAIPLKLPKNNGSYYANATNAEFTNTGQLLPDSVYIRSVQVVVPNYIFGTYFVFVFTNTTNSLYEGALSNNNSNSNQIQVFLTPTPRLTVSSLTLPVTTASTTQPIGANWNTANTGFNDNIEKNKGHYFVQNGTCVVPPAGISIHESLGFGGSYWVDRVYLSTDSTGLNIANAVLVNSTTQGVLNSGLGVPDTLYPDFCQPSGTNPAQFNLNTSNVISQGSNHPKAASFTVPSNLPAGNYYVYVLANATDAVYEYPGTPETRRSALSITIQRPDATVSSVTVPANAIGGQAITINYNVLNNGPGTVFNHTRKDKIYVSTSAVFNGSAQLIDSITYTENLPMGIAVPHTLNYTFPVSTSGTRYFYVHTNYDSTFRETNPNNNVSAAAIIIVTSAAANDLVVSTIQLADTVFSVFPTYLKYTVINNGTGTTAGSTWKDSIFISCSPTFTQATSYYIARRSHNEIVPGGSSYTDSFYVNMPFAFFINNCFPQTNINTAYFYVKTNADNAVYEGSNGNNNITGSGSRVLINPSVDHIVTSVTGPDTATVARLYATSWTVKNIGYNPGSGQPGNYSGWYDAIYFSPDSIFNNNAVIASGFFESTPLNTNQVYSDTRNAIPPNMPTGDYYVFARTNYYPPYGIAHETVLNNNANLIRNGVGAAKKIHVIQPLLPDLKDSTLTAPALVAIGQPITVVHQATNSGAGVTYPSNWSDDVWLSPDFIPGNNGYDILLSGKNHVGALQPGQYYTDTVTVTIPMNVAPGNYILISRVNSTHNLIESNNNNNLAFKYITIFSPAPSDLIVENILKPDTAILGYTLDTARWVIKNISSNAANGISTDGIYLSKNNTLDSTAVLLGIKNKSINMAPLARDTITLQPLVTNVTEGNYHVIVKTDLLNNIVESNKNNNSGITVTQLYVKVKELPMYVLTPNTLFNINRFYKLIIPDSLNGATILVTLKSGDSLSMKNQLFIGKSYVPSAAHFDYTFNTPNYGNQEIVMASVTTGVYYITIRCVSAVPVVQNITLKAVKLPFAILNVHTASGGNSGNVTIKISGSLFVNNMSAKLTKPGTTINASAVYFTNSTTVFATFNLQGRPLGIYDITLIKPDTSMAVLANGFSVVNPNNGGLITGGGVNVGPGDGNSPGCAPGAASGLNSQLVAEIVAPERVLIGWPFVIQINYNNPTNVDIPVQSRTLYNDHDVLMSLTPAGVANGTTSLYLELAEQNGPPGIIRAGGSGSILVYSKMHVSLPRGTVVHFNLK
ncbi:MAG: CARDB domain-containing protein [Chitinophagaceae bacterium]